LNIVNNPTNTNPNPPSITTQGSPIANPKTIAPADIINIKK